MSVAEKLKHEVAESQRSVTSHAYRSLAVQLQGQSGEFRNVVSLRHLRVMTGCWENLLESKRREVGRMARYLYRRGGSRGRAGRRDIVQMGQN